MDPAFAIKWMKKYQYAAYSNPLTVMTKPVDFHGIIADEKFKVKQNTWEAVQLVSQPEISEANKMKWSCDDTELKQQ